LPNKSSVLVLGGGVAGLGAAYLASRGGASTEVVEKLAIPGGLALTRRTADGYYYDLGGHRFYSPSRYVVPFLQRLLGDEFINTPRKSRLYLRGRFFDYPVRLGNVTRQLPLGDCFKMLADCVVEKARSKSGRVENSFEDWVVHRFGRTLYEFNFEGYTRKVWGVEPSTISADWAALRIKGLSLGKVIREFFSRRSDLGTLVDCFLYPRHGIGQISNYLARDVEAQRGRVNLGREVTRVMHDGKRLETILCRDSGGATQEFSADWVASSIDLDRLVTALDPPPPADVLAAARQLAYRDLVTLFVRINSPRVTDDSWIYFPDESVPFGRWHEPKNWSPEMVPDQEHTSLVVEFFSNQGDSFWKASTEELLELTLAAGRKIGLLQGPELGAAEKVLVPHAYPFWGLDYRRPLAIVLGFLERFENLSLVGRNGRFYYSTIDESLISGFAAAANFLEGSRTGPEPLPMEIPANALGYLGLSARDLDQSLGERRWSRND